MSEGGDDGDREGNNDDVDDSDEAALPPRDEVDGRSQGSGEWLEEQLQQALEDWGFDVNRRVTLLILEADVIATRRRPVDEPSDFVIAECKDWEHRSVGHKVIIRLCLLAYIANAMPLLCHTTNLTERAWELAQAYDVRLVTANGLTRYDRLPPLSRVRPPSGTLTHRAEAFADEFRSPPHPQLHRLTDRDVEAAAFKQGPIAPCYVRNRTGHGEYEHVWAPRRTRGDNERER